MSKKRIAIIEDHPMVRLGVTYLLEKTDAYVVVEDAPEIDNAASLITRCRPDMVIIDLTLHDQSGLSFINEIRKASPKTKILVYTMHDDVGSIAKAFRNGAHGYLIKDSQPSVLLKAVDTIFQGDFFIDSQLAPEMVEIIKESQDITLRSKMDYGYNKLTDREKQIFSFLSEGHTPKDVAKMLYISHKTVDVHRNSIMKKLNVKNTAELIRYAVKIGIIRNY